MGTLENVALSTKLKAIYMMDERIDAGGIDVDTIGQFEVHLRGRVPSDVQAKLAEDIAKLNGAHSVVNELAYDRDIEITADVSPAAAGVYGRVTTSEGGPETGLPVVLRVQDALAADDRVNAHLLKVELLDDGMVALSGRQGTVQQREAALDVASQVEGVTGVVDEIEIQPAY